MWPKLFTLDELGKKAVGLGTINPAGLEDVIMNCLQEAGMMRVVDTIENPAPIVNESNNAPQDRSQLNSSKQFIVRVGKCITFQKISSFLIGFA